VALGFALVGYPSLSIQMVRAIVSARRFSRPRLAGGFLLGSAQCLLQQILQFLQLVMVEQPITIGILGDMAGFEHPAVLQLLEEKVLGIETGH